MVAPAVIIAGDTNLHTDRMRELAQEAGCRWVPGHGVDAAFARGVVCVSTRNLGERGSDHPAVLYTFEFPGGEKFRLIAWNVYQGHDPKGVAKQISLMADHYQPHAFALSEAYGQYRALGGIAGYRRHQSRLPFGENRDCALLLRNDLKVAHRGISRMRETWVGPKHGWAKKPRRYPYARVVTRGGLTLRLMAVHLPFGERPQRESLDRIAAWANLSD